MGRKKTRKQSPKNKTYSPKMTEARYQKYLIALLEGQEAAKDGQAVFWDLGPGERPQFVLQDFREVARKETIEVKISFASGGNSLVFNYPSRLLSKKEPIRVLSRDGQVKLKTSE